MITIVASSLSAPVMACSFDSEAIAKDLAQIASRNPGAVEDAQQHAFRWHLASGEVVSISQSGCEDLGAEIRVEFPPSSVPANDVAVRRLIDAISRYWSAEQAQSVKTVWQARSTSDSAEFTVSKAPFFPFGFEITFEGNGVLIQWTEA